MESVCEAKKGCRANRWRYLKKEASRRVAELTAGDI
jgi:hypothetical protein